uniref:Putative AC transposase n=4 Tax=Noccaea caerulescens TaxID=107243 RepID=A0A1J3ESW8_NOCCA
MWKDSCTNTGYICLTAHFIDCSWRLSSKILAFCYLKAPHTGDEMANKVMECMKDWGVEKKVFSITLDNAGNNNSMLRLLKGKLELVNGGGLLCDGKFVHVRCCAHILNLIVKEGLELAKDLLENIKESVIYVKSSQGRKEAFHACSAREGLKGAGLSLDVATRWNSTYEMLVRAVKFRKAFENLASYDPSYKSLPSEEEWNRGEKICDILKPFYVITNLFSGSKYPTSNVYFTQVWRIQLLLMKYSTCDDVAVSDMADIMQVKFDKYWEDYSLVLAMGVVLDPRMKLQLLEKAYEAVDPFTSKLKIKELEDSLTLLYKDYRARACPSSGVSTTPTPQELVTESPLEDDDFDIDIFELERSIGIGVSNTKTHLDIYLKEPRLERAAFPNFDVLGYWKDNQHRFGDLAMMARDLLSIPITTVASESAFSIGSRVLTPYRNRLLPDNVQALLCTRNWLRGFAESEGKL